MLVAVTATTAVVLLIIGAVVLFRPSRPKGPDHPAQWDPRVADLVAFVEQQTGSKFDHPVYIDFLPEEEFKVEVSGSDEPLSDEERRDADRAAAMFRALGLLSGDVDLAAEQQDLTAGGTAASYRPDDKRIRVRGTELDVFTKGTLVHELTHAWQDQQFDLSRIDRFETDEEATAFRSVAEGHATNVEEAWVDALSDTDRKAYDALEDKAVGTATDEIADVPGVLVASFDAPYEFGPPFVQFMEDRDGSAGIRRAFTSPPTSSEQLMDPWTYIDHDDPDADPELDTKGAPSLDEGQFGALFWYLLLADRIDPHVALRAADGWGADRYATYEQDGRTCVTARFTGDTATDETELADAAGQWAATLPPQAGATVAAGPDGVDLRTCDPGKDVVFDVPDRIQATIGLPVIRLLAWSGSAGAGSTDDEARCFGEQFAAALTLDDLSSTEPISDERLAALREAAYAAC